MGNKKAKICAAALVASTLFVTTPVEAKGIDWVNLINNIFSIVMTSNNRAKQLELSSPSLCACIVSPCNCPVLEKWKILTGVPSASSLVTSANNSQTSNNIQTYNNAQVSNKTLTPKTEQEQNLMTTLSSDEAKEVINVARSTKESTIDSSMITDAIRMGKCESADDMSGVGQCAIAAVSNSRISQDDTLTLFGNAVGDKQAKAVMAYQSPQLFAANASEEDKEDVREVTENKDLNNEKLMENLRKQYEGYENVMVNAHTALESLKEVKETVKENGVLNEESLDSANRYLDAKRDMIDSIKNIDTSPIKNYLKSERFAASSAGKELKKLEDKKAKAEEKITEASQKLLEKADAIDKAAGTTDSFASKAVRRASENLELLGSGNETNQLTAITNMQQDVLNIADRVYAAKQAITERKEAIQEANQKQPQSMLAKIVGGASVLIAGLTAFVAGRKQNN